MPVVSVMAPAANGSTGGPEEDACFACPLCCEEKPSSSVCILSNCGHESCRSCCVKWIEKAEAAGHHNLPACPWCRVSMTAKETRNFLGRSFRQKTNNAATADAAEVDELTLQWIRERTRQCPGCGVYIERLSGCDAMECLCGFQFCFRCGARRGACTCLGRPQYYDNILQQHTDAAPPRVAADARTGTVDFRRCIRVREQIGAGQAIRVSRRNRHRSLKREIEELDQPTASSPWLFCKTRRSVVKMIRQIGQTGRLRQARERRKRQQEMLEIGQIGRMLKEIENLDQPTAASRWLFNRTRRSILKIIDQISQTGHVRLARESRERIQARKEVQDIEQMLKEIKKVDHLTTSAPWLFCRKRRWSLKRLNQILQRDRMAAVREKSKREQERKRAYQIEQMLEEIEKVDHLTTSAPWLFCRKGESSAKRLNQILQQDHMAQKRQVALRRRTEESKRQLDEMMQEILEYEFLDRPTFSAPWLFHKHGLKLLDQITQTAGVRHRRGQRNQRKAEEEAWNTGGYGAKWLYGCKNWQWLMIPVARGFYEERRKGAMYHKSISSYAMDR